MSQNYAARLSESDEFRLLDEALEAARRRPKAAPPSVVGYRMSAAGLEAAARRSLPRPLEERPEVMDLGPTAAVLRASGYGANGSTQGADERRVLLAAIVSLLQQELHGPARGNPESGRARRRRRRRRKRRVSIEPETAAGCGD